MSEATSETSVVGTSETSETVLESEVNAQSDYGTTSAAVSFHERSREPRPFTDKLPSIFPDRRRKIRSFQSSVLSIRADIMWKICRWVVPLLDMLWDNCEVKFCRGEDCRSLPFRYVLRGPSPGQEGLVETYAELTKRDDDNMHAKCSLVFSVPFFKSALIEVQLRPITAGFIGKCYCEIRRSAIITGDAKPEKLKEALDTLGRGELLRMEALVEDIVNFDYHAYWQRVQNQQSEMGSFFHIPEEFAVPVDITDKSAEEGESATAEGESATAEGESATAESTKNAMNAGEENDGAKEAEATTAGEEEVEDRQSTTSSMKSTITTNSTNKKQTLHSYQSTLLPILATDLWKMLRFVVPLLKLVWSECTVEYCHREDYGDPPYRYMMTGPSPGCEEEITTFAEVFERDDDNMYVKCGLVYAVPHFDCGTIEVQLRPLPNDGEVCFIEIRRTADAQPQTNAKNLLKELDSLARIEFERIRQHIPEIKKFSVDEHLAELAERQAKEEEEVAAAAAAACATSKSESQSLSSETAATAVAQVDTSDSEMSAQEGSIASNASDLAAHGCDEHSVDSTNTIDAAVAKVRVKDASNKIKKKGKDSGVFDISSLEIREQLASKDEQQLASKDDRHDVTR